MGKAEIAHYEQFLLFPQCFQKAGFPEASKGVIVWEWVKEDLEHTRLFNINPFPINPRFSSNSSLLKTLWEKEKLLITINFSYSH